MEKKARLQVLLWAVNDETVAIKKVRFELTLRIKA
jgi:hypothetical protein